MLQMETLVADPPPFQFTSNGGIRIAGTRVSLDSILYLHNEGLSPAEIGEQFPSVPVADIYAAVSYYLHHQSEVEAYLAEQKKLGEALKAEIQARFPNTGLREKLLARKAQLDIERATMANQ